MNMCQVFVDTPTIQELLINLEGPWNGVLLEAGKKAVEKGHLKVDLLWERADRAATSKLRTLIPFCLDHFLDPKQFHRELLTVLKQERLTFSELKVFSLKIEKLEKKDSYIPPLLKQLLSSKEEEAIPLFFQLFATLSEKEQKKQGLLFLQVLPKAFPYLKELEDRNTLIQQLIKYNLNTDLPAILRWQATLAVLEAENGHSLLIDQAHVLLEKLKKEQVVEAWQYWTDLCHKINYCYTETTFLHLINKLETLLPSTLPSKDSWILFSSTNMLFFETITSVDKNIQEPIFFFLSQHFLRGSEQGIPSPMNDEERELTARFVCRTILFQPADHGISKTDQLETITQGKLLTPYQFSYIQIPRDKKYRIHFQPLIIRFLVLLSSYEKTLCHLPSHFPMLQLSCGIWTNQELISMTELFSKSAAFHTQKKLFEHRQMIGQHFIRKYETHKGIERATAPEMVQKCHKNLLKIYPHIKIDPTLPETEAIVQAICASSFILDHASLLRKSWMFSLEREDMDYNEMSCDLIRTARNCEFFNLQHAPQLLQELLYPSIAYHKQNKSTEFPHFELLKMVEKKKEPKEIKATRILELFEVLTYSTKEVPADIIQWVMANNFCKKVLLGDPLPPTHLKELIPLLRRVHMAFVLSFSQGRALEEALFLAGEMSTVLDQLFGVEITLIDLYNQNSSEDFFLPKKELAGDLIRLGQCRQLVSASNYPRVQEYAAAFDGLEVLIMKKINEKNIFEGMTPEAFVVAQEELIQEDLVARSPPFLFPYESRRKW